MRNTYSFPLFLVLIAAGLAGNHFNYPIFLNIDFLFGSIFAMLALQFFGLRQGILAAAMIASYTYILWNHPYAIIIMTAEVAVVGWLMGRRKIGLVMADTLYWLLLGMPLVYLFYYIFMHVPLSNASITMTKQAINGIANALVARLIFSGYALLSRTQEVSYRENVYNLLTFFVLFPALIILAISSRADFSETDNLIRAKLRQDSQRVSDIMSTWMQNRHTAILNLAEMAASRSPKQMQPFIEMAKKSDINFQRIGLLDKDATITAYYPLLDEQGRSNIGKNFADRPFIPELKRTLKPMFSEVVMGRIGPPKPIVTMLAPVVSRGGYGGYVTGILSLERISKFLELSAEDSELLFTLLDKNGNVIMTNRRDQTAMTPFARGKGALHQLDQSISQWIPVMPSNITISERWRQSSYVVDSMIGSLSEWRLILEQPVAPFQKTLYACYAGHLTRLFLILIGAMALAELVSRQSIATLEKLRLITRDLPLRLATENKELDWPESSIRETNQLIGNFREMATALTQHYDEIQLINESLEQRVIERTQELQESEEKFRTVANFTHEWEYWRGPQGQMVWISPSCQQITGFSAEQFMQDRMLVRNIIHPEDKPKFNGHIDKVDSQSQEPCDMDIRIVKKNGEIIWINHRCRSIHREDGTYLGRRATNRDVTKRKFVENQLRESEERLRQLLDESPISIMAFDGQGTVTFVNKWHLTKFARGLLPSEYFLDRPVWELKGIASAGIGDKMRAILLGEELHLPEIYVPEYATGQDGYQRMHGVPLYQGGKVVGGLLMREDITEHKQAEMALQQSELKFRELFEASPIGILIADSKGVVQQVNQALASIFGVDDKSRYNGLDLLNATSGLVQKSATDAIEHGESSYDGPYESVLTHKKIHVKINTKMHRAELSTKIKYLMTRIKHI